jgi:hypothetical protein
VLVEDLELDGEVEVVEVVDPGDDAARRLIAAFCVREADLVLRHLDAADGRLLLAAEVVALPPGDDVGLPLDEVPVVRGRTALVGQRDHPHLGRFARPAAALRRLELALAEVLRRDQRLVGRERRQAPLLRHAHLVAEGLVLEEPARGLTRRRRRGEGREDDANAHGPDLPFPKHGSPL